MGSPVSVVVAEIMTQNIEGSAHSTCRQTILLWLRYVDDAFTAERHDEIDAFHHHLKEQNTDIQFTREVEENGKLPFLDCLVSCNENSLRTAVYRKPKNTDRLLDESSYNPTSHKANMDSLSDENKYLDRVFSTPTTKTSSNATLTDLLLLPRLTTTQLLRPQ